MSAIPAAALPSGLILLLALAHPALASDESGEALYRGQGGLVAHLRGHAQALPPEVARCIQCHDTGTGPGAVSGAALAPRLDHTTLLTPLPRRGGPPTAYDEASFCRVLRTGLGPESILLRRTMPQYTISDAQCQALWTHLSTRPAVAEAAR